MKKKFCFFLIFFVSGILIYTTASASEPDIHDALFQDTTIVVLANGVRVPFPDYRQPDFEGGFKFHNIFVPMRFVFEALGFDVHWNDETREAFFSKDEKTVRVVVGSEFIYVNEEQYKICGSGEIIAWLANDRIMLPLASVRYFGYAVEWVPGGDFVRTIFNLVPESEFTTGIFDIEPFTSTIIFTPGSGTGNPRAVTHTFFYPIKLWSPHYAGLQWNFSNGSGVFDGWLLIKPSDTLICTGDSREEWDGTVFREDAEVTFSEDVTLAARWSF